MSTWYSTELPLQANSIEFRASLRTIRMNLFRNFQITTMMTKAS